MKIFQLDTTLAYFLLMWVGGRRHCGRQEQHGREDQGGRLHQDISLWLEFFQLGCHML